MTYSGLPAKDRATARRLIYNACRLMVNHGPTVHYTQDMFSRWEGIRQGLRAWKGEYPRHSDCSACATWILWQPYRHFHLRDKVNGTDWQTGYTGTLSKHGKTIRGTLKIGDLIFYGSAWPYEHVTISLGGRLVFSHGSEAGPYLLDIDYRSDRKVIKRFI
jgi:hypothetical protein